MPPSPLPVWLHPCSPFKSWGESGIDLCLEASDLAFSPGRLILSSFCCHIFFILAYQLTKSHKEMQLCKAGFNSGIVVEEPMVVSTSGCRCELRTAEVLALRFCRLVGVAGKNRRFLSWLPVRELSLPSSGCAVAFSLVRSPKKGKGKCWKWDGSLMVFHKSIIEGG